jgi:hypothetical protein
VSGFAPDSWEVILLIPTPGFLVSKPVFLSHSTTTSRLYRARVIDPKRFSGAIESRSPRNCGLDLVGVSTFLPTTVDNRGGIEVGHPVGDACVRIKSRGDKSASIEL